MNIIHFMKFCFLLVFLLASTWTTAQSTDSTTVETTQDTISPIDTASDNTVTASVDTTINNNKIKSKKVKKPIMGGLFIEPEGLYPSPKRAMQLSLILPGAGQIYNKKNAFVWAPFWMLGTAAGVTGIVYFRNQYKFYRDEYRLAQWNLPYTLQDRATAAQVQSERDNFRKYSEQAIFGTIGFYLLNGIHAFSQAHLLNFDINDDLSLQIAPTILNNLSTPSPTLGVSCSFSPKVTVQPQPIDWLNTF